MMTGSHKAAKHPSPTIEQILDRRKAAGLIQAKAGELLHTNQKVWSQWETGKRQMHYVFWELFCIKTEPLIRKREHKLVRVTAEYKEGGHRYSDYCIVVLCGIDQERRLAPGEWFGYVRNEKLLYPFVLRLGKEFFYGGDDPWAEPTNIGQHEIKVGTHFTLSNSPDDTEIFDAVYAVTNIHPIAG